MRNSLRNGSRAVTLTAALALTVSACGSGGGSAGGDTSGQKTIDVTLAAFQGSFNNFPVYVANDLGLFKKHGLNVEITYGTGKQVSDALASGSTNFAAAAVEHAVQLQAKHQDVKVVVMNQTAEPSGLIVRNEVPLPHANAPYPQNLMDLKGLKLGISTPGASTDLTLRYLLQDAGLDPDKDVTIVPVGGVDTQLAALKQGKVDGTLAFEPIQLEAINVQHIAKSVLDLETGKEGPAVFREYAENGVEAKADWLQGHQEAAKRMVASIAEAEKMIQDDAQLDKVVNVAVKEFPGIPQDALSDYIKTHKDIWAPSASKTGVDNVSQFLFKFKEIDAKVPFDQLISPLMPRNGNN